MVLQGNPVDGESAPNGISRGEMVAISADRCVGSGLCQAMAPHIFGSDEHGRIAKVLRPRPEERDLGLIRDIAECCPVEAVLIRTTDGQS
ncbi:ferredoxin [Microbispora sp. KK1-11]|uniref:ferredoxin n=1 Tax=Microbispora sp. KK1-11 TaxID=2053005 RepID=UPI00115A5F0A|nr:ferredoxin [Microbispora sp. KK1-11]